MENLIQHGTFLRNGNGNTVQVLFHNQDANQANAYLNPIDYEGTTKIMPTKTLHLLYERKNYVIVKDPNNINERYVSKSIGSERFLVRS